MRIPGDPHPIEVTESRHLKILCATAELVPFAKSGSVADVTAALSKELHRLGHDVRLVMPRYRQIDIAKHGLKPLITELQVPFGRRAAFADAKPSELALLVDSYGMCALAFDQRSAAAELKLRAGKAFTLVALTDGRA